MKIIFTLVILCSSIFCEAQVFGPGTIPLSGTTPVPQNVLGSRLRAINELGGATNSQEEIYLGVPDLGTAGNRVAAQFVWNTSSTWNFKLEYSLSSNTLTQTVTNGIITSTTPISNYSSFATARGITSFSLNNMNFLNISFRTVSAGATLTISNLKLKNVVLYNGSIVVNNAVSDWCITSFNFSSDWDFSGTFTTSGTFSSSAEGNRINIAVGYTNAVIPVVWGNVGVQQNANNHTISWETLQEAQVARYEVEASNDGVSFETIGNRASYGNSSFISRYQFITPITYIFYRIKQIDINGNFKYSTTVRVNSVQDKEVVIANNPIIDKALKLTFKNNAERKIAIYNPQGKLIKIVNTESNAINIVLPNNVINGQYYGKIFNGNNKVYNSIKFMVD